MKEPDSRPFAEAVDRFFVDLGAQQLNGDTVRKYENLMRRRLLPCCAEEGSAT